MFKDYYLILGIEFGASDDIIKKTYREMSLRWHPDKSNEKDANKMMYDINEAYYILSNHLKRERYNKEYIRYKQQSSFVDNHLKTNFRCYDIKDEAVKNDIENARKKSIKDVDEFMTEIKQNLVNATKSAYNEIIPWIIGLFLMSILTLMIQNCN